MKLALCRGLALGIVLATPSLAAPPETLTFDEVRAGMTGTGLTVFEGTRIESFDVEILGKLPNIGPGQNLILGRLSGGPLARTGVLAGMSGSPVMIDGRLIGAVAYSWSFSKDAIAGITPIHEMLAIQRMDGPALRRGGLARPSDLTRLHAPEGWRDFFVSRFGELLQPAAAAPLAVPLAISGVRADQLRAMWPEAVRSGLLPLQSGGATARPETSPPLAPGSAMGLKLVRGDVDITATGTVTWVDDGQVLALGHPLFGLGSVDLPLTGARVQALLPSLGQSARLASPLSEVGALRQDRAAGVLGQLGADPRMIPVRLRLSSATGERTFAFDIADDVLLAPLLLYVSLNGILGSTERVFGSATMRLEPGSAIHLDTGRNVELDNVFAGSSAFTYATGLPAYVLHLLMNNAWTEPRIAGVNLLMSYEAEPRSARIRRVSVDRFRVAPGDEVAVGVVIAPYRGPDRLLKHRFTVPPDCPPGQLVLDVTSAIDLTRNHEPDESVLPRSLDQLVWLINQLRRHDQLYFIASVADDGVMIDGVRLPSLPPSVARVLSRPRSEGNFIALPRRSLLEEALNVGESLEGFARVELDVIAR